MNDNILVRLSHLVDLTTYHHTRQAGHPPMFITLASPNGTE